MKRIRGINDESDTCSACGKTGLKKVVWIDDSEAGLDAEPFGVNCAALIMLGNKTRANTKTVETMAKRIQFHADAVHATASKWASPTLIEAARACRTRNTREVGCIVTLELEGVGFFSKPEICSEDIEALISRGWKEVARA